MKRMIAMMLCAAMLLSLAACGKSSANDAEQPNLIAQETVPVQETAAAEEATLPAETEAAEEPEEETVEATEAATEPTTGKDSDSGSGKETEATEPEEEQTAEVLPSGDYNEGIVLVKVKDQFSEADLGELAYTAAEPLFAGAKWYAVTLTDSSKTVEAVSYLTALGTFEQVDYDYVMATDTSVDVSGNPHYDDHYHHHTHKIPDGWQYAADNDSYAGGSSDVVVAVIDTGVDYTHLDLRNNIWTNTAEIAGNGIDDDGNGYIDDVYGWDCVGDDNDPMDDNGHGTHVAGIIAAENNEIGGVGIAYNSRIMVLKAGNSSGYFNNSDIAEAVQYAYMNGASVINMSFGGSSISFVVRESLETAYTNCILVAAAGNDGACNNLSCKVCDYKAVMYPAALPCVIGVMSVSADGSRVSSFSNYDHYPYNSVEYDVYAVGESIPSCWPGNKYTKLNGTSMATPTVAGIAALLRSYLPDRNVYSTKFIQSQIVNTGTVYAYNAVIEDTDNAHSVVNIYEALTQLPKPEVKLYDYSINDSTDISELNNGNGVIDAGETVRLSVALQNRGGVASNVKVSVNALRNGLADYYFTFVNDTMELADIGTYSIRESGDDNYFEIQVSADCPNDYLVDFNICFTYTNGMDPADETVYSDDGNQTAQFNISRGWHLPATVTDDTVFAADRLYILGEDMVIAEGVTVTFEAGCEIQYYDDREYFNSPIIKNYGTLNFNGAAGNMISIHPNERHSTFTCFVANYGTMNMDYISGVNTRVMGLKSSAVTCVSNSDLYTAGINAGSYKYVYTYASGQTDTSGAVVSTLFGTYESIGKLTYTNNYIELNFYQPHFDGNNFSGNYVVLRPRSGGDIEIRNAENNVFFMTATDNTAHKNGTVELYGYARNNAFYVTNDQLSYAMILDIADKTQFANNTLSTVYQDNATALIADYIDSTGNATVDVNDQCENIALLWPQVTKVEILDSNGEATDTVGKETVSIRVTFNRPMDQSAGTYLTFGTQSPYGDYRIDGSYVDEYTWEGVYSLKAEIENGQNFLRVHNAWAAESSRMRVIGEHNLHEFTIDTSAALAMSLVAAAEETGIRLTWAQDDYSTLLGYNIYRSNAKDGNYVKLNPTILLPSDVSFLDENAEPGKTYWYTFTVVLSDFSESNPAGKVAATALDTMAPALYHTPVNQGYENNNLVIACTASDNVGISAVTLYYRTTGGDWKELSMLQTNDRFSATIYGSEVTLAGIEYYIVAADEENTVTKGSADAPYSVVIKTADTLSGKGDVDGDGTVSTKDALMLMQCHEGGLLLTDDEFKRADLNGDGVLSATEALKILQYVNGKITSLT